jgi:tetratricopeptide (TPR) repeat protein
MPRMPETPASPETPDDTPEAATGARDEREASSTDDRESPYALLRRGQELLKKRHHAQAAVVLERARKLEPARGSIVEALGRAYYNSGDYVRAAEAFGQLVEIDPVAAYGHYGLGLSLKRLGRRDRARGHLRLAVAMAPTSELYRGALERLEAAG